MTTVASQKEPWSVIYDQRGSQSVNGTIKWIFVNRIYLCERELVLCG